MQQLLLPFVWEVGQKFWKVCVPLFKHMIKNSCNIQSRKQNLLFDPLNCES